MNANAIQEKILSDARTGASDIMRDANEKAARLRDAAEKRMAAAHSRLMMPIFAIITIAITNP